MGNLSGFDARQHEPMQTFDVIPPGKYLAAITESEMKDNSKGTGKYLKLTFQILEGQHKGRNLWVNLNLVHPNEQAVQIARGELSSICRALGVPTPNDSSDLHNIPLVITVKLQKRADTGEDQNVVKGYAKQEGIAAAADDSPPWK